jgi:hypothetical protein
VRRRGFRAASAKRCVGRLCRPRPHGYNAGYNAADAPGSGARQGAWRRIFMGILGNILSSIFGHAHAAPAGTPAPASPAPSGSAPSTTSSAPLPKATTPVDVSDVLTKLAASNKEHLDWKHSIVDLMKLLNMDSSLAARKELAGELHYSGDTGDSASMNMWLHKQVMQKLAENGGKVPAELLHK